ncbi:thioredoxin domain-containing protein [Streptomyces sp. DSM 44915]|uniref:Thioredoxin domain-containing protein n=1 Tax=Streptomyces chisholmiae TaxID=3075540 RepID=A0ABU2JTC7_9ACTN|nr:thioredoxin domain-containing protein [Streptomyces sp. DSM 44915]MDT0268246.1 thioredoxin domain-containing protein [Streptomyces sp. DSM 44915]
MPETTTATACTATTSTAPAPAASPVDGAVTEVTDATFATEVLAAPLPVLVKFTADWCPPCRMMTPVLAELAAERAGRLRIVTLDIDHNPRTTVGYGVLSAPTLMLFRDGQPIRAVVGARPKARLAAELDAAL